MEAHERFRALFTKAYPALRRYAHHRGVTGADADDLVAGALTVAWRRLDAVPVDDPLPWLFAVSRNLWRNELRRRRRGQSLTDRLQVHADGAVAGHEPSGIERGAIRAALGALSDDDQEILRLVAWDGLSPHQLAAALGVSDGTARVRLHRARARFAARLELDATNAGLATVHQHEPPTPRRP